MCTPRSIKRWYHEKWEAGDEESTGARVLAAGIGNIRNRSDRQRSECVGPGLHSGDGSCKISGRRKRGTRARPRAHYLREREYSVHKACKRGGIWRGVSRDRTGNGGSPESDRSAAVAAIHQDRQAERRIHRSDVYLQRRFDGRGGEAGEMEGRWKRRRFIHKAPA